MKLSRQRLGQNLYKIALGRQPLSIWHRSKLTQQTMKIDAVERLLRNCEVVKVQVDESGRTLLLLDSAGRLTVWDFQRHAVVLLSHTPQVADNSLLTTD